MGAPALTVGLPSSRTPPSFFGIACLRTDCGRQRPGRRSSPIRDQCAATYVGNSSAVIPSMPGLPWSFFTGRSAASTLLRLPWCQDGRRVSWIVARRGERANTRWGSPSLFRTRTATSAPDSLRERLACRNQGSRAGCEKPIPCRTWQEASRLRGLEREVVRKDKALAEAAALLIPRQKSTRCGGTRTTTRTRGKRSDPRRGGSGASFWRSPRERRGPRHRPANARSPFEEVRPGVSGALLDERSRTRVGRALRRLVRRSAVASTGMTFSLGGTSAPRTAPVLGASMREGPVRGYRAFERPGRLGASVVASVGAAESFARVLRAQLLLVHAAVRVADVP